MAGIWAAELRAGVGATDDEQPLVAPADEAPLACIIDPWATDVASRWSRTSRR